MYTVTAVSEPTRSIRGGDPTGGVPERSVERKVREGGSLWQSLEETGLFSDIAIEMTKVGESTGSLQEMLTHVADFYDEEIDNRLQTLIALLEPAMLIGMGFLIGVMFLAIYLPLLRSYAQSSF